MHVESSLERTSVVGQTLFETSPYEYLVNFSSLKNDPRQQEHLRELLDKLFTSDGISSTQKTKDRGDVLEDFGDFLLRSSGLFQLVESNTKGLVHELDHSCEFVGPAFDVLNAGLLKSRRVLGESKNYKDAKIDVNIVYKVGAISVFQNFSLAIIFSRKGLTGTELNYACNVTQKFRNKMEIAFVVFNDEDYKILNDYPFAFNILFYNKLRRWLDHNDYRIDYAKISSSLKELKDSGVLDPKPLGDLLK